MRLDGKVAVITGGGSGMGKIASELFAGEGAKVVLTDVNDEAGEAAAAGIVAGGGDAAYVHADVSKESEAEAMVRRGRRAVRRAAHPLQQRGRDAAR